MDGLDYDDLRIEKLWQIIVMLKRDLDEHVSNPSKYEFMKSTWEEAMKRCSEILPDRVH